MTSVVALYEALTTAPDDRTRARVIAEAFERLEDRYPHLPDLATQAHLRETELRLQKEIEQIRFEITQIRAETEQLRAELKTDIERLRSELTIEIEHLRSEVKSDIERVRADLTLNVERLRGEITRTKIDLLKWLVPLMFAQVAAIAALVKLL